MTQRIALYTDPVFRELKLQVTVLAGIKVTISSWWICYFNYTSRLTQSKECRERVNQVLNPSLLFLPYKLRVSLWLYCICFLLLHYQWISFQFTSKNTSKVYLYWKFYFEYFYHYTRSIFFQYPSFGKGSYFQRFRFNIDVK